MIKGLTADIITSIYLLLSLGLRIYIEPNLETHPFISLALGGVMLFFLWALIKTEFLKPNYFGLLDKPVREKTIDSKLKTND